jgi:hypothetical protein
MHTLFFIFNLFFQLYNLTANYIVFLSKMHTVHSAIGNVFMTAALTFEVGVKLVLLNLCFWDLVW